MAELPSVSKPQPREGGLESMAVEVMPERRVTRGHDGAATQEPLRSLKYLVVKGKSAPLPRRNVSSALESIMGVDERMRILDTDLAPWRMICALRMRGANGAGAIGTGWLVGPKTVITAGHCVLSSFFFDGWASAIEVSPGRNGDSFPYETTTSTRFSSVNRWMEGEDPDFDIGCIHLEEPIGSQVGWFQVAALPPDARALRAAPRGRAWRKVPLQPVRPAPVLSSHRGHRHPPELARKGLRPRCCSLHRRSTAGTAGINSQVKRRVAPTVDWLVPLELMRTRTRHRKKEEPR